MPWGGRISLSSSAGHKPRTEDSFIDYLLAFSYWTTRSWIFTPAVATPESVYPQFDPPACVVSYQITISGNSTSVGVQLALKIFRSCVWLFTEQCSCEALIRKGEASPLCDTVVLGHYMWRYKELAALLFGFHTSWHHDYCSRRPSRTLPKVMAWPLYNLVTNPLH